MVGHFCHAPANLVRFRPTTFSFKGDLAMATSPNATAFMTMLSGSAGAGPALAQPTISFIQSQITAMLPSQYASAITAQFAGASSASALPSAVAAQPAMPVASGGMAAAFGPGLAQPTIDYIQAQITALVPSQYAASVLAQFNAATSSASAAAASAAAASAAGASAAGVPAQPPAGAAMQALMISNQLKEFFTGMTTPSM